MKFFPEKICATTANAITFAAQFDETYVLRVIAEVAQLVEHDLAKVGVASSSLVFRSKPSRN
jgi:hypothetical protein